MNHNTNNRQCDICAGSGKCEYCGGKNYDEMITADRLRNAFFDTLKKGKLYKISFNKIEQSIMIEEDWLVFGEAMDYSDMFKVEQICNRPFNFYEKSYREIFGDVYFVMASHVVVYGDHYSRYVVCLVNNE